MLVLKNTDLQSQPLSGSLKEPCTLYYPFSLQYCRQLAIIIAIGGASNLSNATSFSLDSPLIDKLMTTMAA